MKEPRVKEIVLIYQKGNIAKVKEYLNQTDMIIEPSTWTYQIKQMIEKEQYYTAQCAIELISYKFINLI
jgi:hypothetical protein